MLIISASVMTSGLIQASTVITVTRKAGLSATDAYWLLPLNFRAPRRAPVVHAGPLYVEPPKAFSEESEIAPPEPSSKRHRPTRPEG